MVLKLKTNRFYFPFVVYGNKSMVERNGGVQAAITSLRTMSHNPDVVELALKMLGNLIELGMIIISILHIVPL